MSTFSHPEESRPRRRGGSVLAPLAAALRDFQSNARGDAAAGLTYYAVLASVPFMVVIVAAVGLFGQGPRTSNAILEWIGEIGPASATETFRGTVEGVIGDRRSAGTLFGVGIVAALWTTAGWLDAFVRVANDVHGVGEDRRFAVRKAMQLAATFGVSLAVAVLATLAVVSGPLARNVAHAIGAGDGVVTLWSAAQWPIAAALAIVLLAVMFRFAPARNHPSWTTALIGSTVAGTAWTLASVGFGLYVSRFGSYNATYGALGAVIVLLVWLWITHAAFILGVAVDAAVLRARRLAPTTPTVTTQTGDCVPARSSDSGHTEPREPAESHGERSPGR
jgi:membrane protein